ncbi:MAG: ABC transporter permease [Chloroflexi bacterium]|nr:ABC transporter permease [Chloroflexota bacterium]
MSSASISSPTQVFTVRQSTFAQDIWRRFRRNRLALAGLGIVVALCIFATFAQNVAPYDPIEVNLDIQFDPPSLQHLFGADLYGRDLFSRVIYGARISLLIGFIPSAISMMIGAALGVLAAFYGRWVDTLIMRLADVVLAFPSIILAMVVTYTLGASLFTLFIALSVVGWAGAARVVRAQALAIKETDFVTASKSVGASDRRIMFNHIIPNCIAPILVLFTLSIPEAIMAEAGLSFLGVGAQPPTPSWGLMVNEAQQYVFNAPWASILPGLAILVTTLGFNFVGDGLRDAIDPYLKSKM